MKECFSVKIFFCFLVLINLSISSFADQGSISMEENDLSYRLGPSDVVNINVDYMPEISKTYEVSEKGEILFPTLLEPLKVKGLTLDELKKTLRSKLSEYIIDPKVSVDITGYHSHRILILGPFRNPGRFELKREKVPLLDLITETGGLLEIREDDEVIIRRRAYSNNDSSEPDQSIIRVNLKKLILEGDITQNVMIQAGDVVSLESFFTAKKNVYIISGGRQGTGIIPYEPGLTAFTAILKAGVKLDSTQTFELLVIRKQSDSEELINTQLKLDSANPSIGDISLLPEDIIMLPDSAINTVNMAGEVVKQGPVTYKENMTIFEAIQAAGGMTNKAVPGKVKILRKSELGRNQILVNMNSILQNWDKDHDVVLMPGDIVLVPEVSLQEDVMVSGKVINSKIVPYEPDMTALRAILLAGGLSNNAVSSQIRIIKKNGDVMPSFLFDMSKTRAEAINPILDPGDHMIVLGPSSVNSIIITGKVLKQGIIDFEEGLTVFGAIMKAGGFADGAAKSKISIIRGEGKQQKNIRVDLGDLENNKSRDIPLLPGDIIRIPESFF